MAENQVASAKIRPTAGLLTAATIGTLIDWYDFALSSVIAAIVWPVIFFSFLPAGYALLISVSAYIISYVTRPLGSFIFGHYGDKLGRKRILLITLILGGAATFGIAFTPSYAIIGAAGAALIILFRLLYGIAMGGEYGGANSWVSEFAAKSRHRGFWLGFVNATLWLGFCTSALAFYFTFKFSGPHAFIFSNYFGWRIPFYIGGVVLFIGVIMRYRMSESPLFKELQAERKVEKFPAASLFRQTGKRIVPLMLLNVAGIMAALIIGNGPFLVAYLKGQKFNPLTIFEGIAIATGIAAITGMISSTVSDRFGRKNMFVFGSILLIIVVVPVFLLLNTLDVVYVIIGLTIAEVAASVPNTVQGILLSEQFPTKFRYSGTGLSFNISSLIGSIFGAVVAVSIGNYYATSAAPSFRAAWPAVAVMLIIWGVVSLVAGLMLKETRTYEMGQTEPGFVGASEAGGSGGK